MKVSKIVLISSILPIIFLSTSCSSTKKTEPPKEQATPTETPKAVTQNPESFESLKTIYFDYNKFNIRDDQKNNALQIAKFLNENPKIALQIQGNTDSRGSAEYNMALGQKRAQSLKKFLMINGAKNSIETISYGKERPAMPGDSEEAWAKNRRDDIVKIK